MIEVLFFGRMADIVGKRDAKVAVAVEGTRLFALRDAMFATALAGGGVRETDIRMSVNRVVVQDDQPVNAGDEVAFFSVFSGG